MGEAKAIQLAVPRRHEEAGAPELLRRPDQGLEVFVGLSDRVAEEGDARRVARDPAAALDDAGGAFPDGVADLSGAIVPVHPHADAVAGREIALARPAHGVARHRHLDRGALHDHHGLAHVEAERGVEAERPVVVGGLEQADAGNRRSSARASTASMSRRPTPAFCPSGSTVIGPTPAIVERSSRKLLPTMRPSRSATTEWTPGMGEEMTEDHGGGGGGREVRRETVALRDRAERLVADAPTGLRVGRACPASGSARGHLRAGVGVMACDRRWCCRASWALLVRDREESQALQQLDQSPRIEVAVLE